MYHNRKWQEKATELITLINTKKQHLILKYGKDAVKLWRKK